MFRIVGDQGTIWYYNVETNTVYDSLGAPLNLMHLDSAKTCLNLTDFSNDIYCYNALDYHDHGYVDNHNLQDLSIQLGMNCNYNCVYCCQEICAPDDLSKTDIDGFLHRLKNLDINWKTLKCIQLWGGEPLVYWKFLTKIVKCIREEITDYKGMIHFITNGSLFNQEKFDFIRKYKIIIQISHDGVNHAIQRRTDYDWLDDEPTREFIIDWLGRCHHGAVNITFAPINNPNLMDSLELFYNKIPGVPICARAPLRCDATNQHLMGLYTKKNIEIASDAYYTALTLPPNHKYYYMMNPSRYRTYQLVKNFIYSQPIEGIRYNCPSKQKRSMVFNLHGDYLPCHGSSVAMHCGVGSMDTPNACYDIKFISAANREKCKHCLYSQICQGPCGMHNSYNEYIHCKSMNWAYKVWFNVVWKTVFGEKPIEITNVTENSN